MIRYKMFKIFHRVKFLSILKRYPKFPTFPVKLFPYSFSTMEDKPKNDVLKKRTLEESLMEDLKNPDDAKSEDSDTGADNLNEKDADPLRVCLQGLDKFWNEKDVLKFIKNNSDPSIELDAITKSKGNSHAFVSFLTIENKERFVKDMTGKKYKTKKLKIRPVKLSHPALKFEKKIKKLEEVSKPKECQLSEEELKAEMDLPIQDKVCPLWQTPYEEQIKIKTEALNNVLKKITATGLKQLGQDDTFLPKWLKSGPDHPCCPISEFIGADENNRFYYRNKSEFTIGESYEHKGAVKVGFNKGNFNKGFMYVESAQECPIVSKESLELAQLLEDYIKTTGIPAYNRTQHSGFWRNFVVRQSDKTSEMLLSVVVCKKNSTEEEYQKIKPEILELFTKKYNSPKHKIVSIIIQDHSSVSDNIPWDASYEILDGFTDFFNDEILGYKFRVNVNAFLQVNSAQCEKLYSLVKNLSNVDKDTIFLDICCGIGTIGLCSASNAKKILGVEMVERAIKDAEFNATLNGIENAEFKCAKVENVITDMIKPYAGNSKIIGVVDPPRSGLHKDVVRGLRTCKGLDTLVYVSCNPEGSAIENILGLCMPENKRRRGPPFTVVEAYGVDLFPQTHHFEGVFVLKRLYEKNY